MRQRDGRDWLCGQEAAAYLRGLVRDRAVTCTRKDRDRYGRVVAVCRAGGQDLNRTMVRSGLAWAYTACSRDYQDAELEARLSRRGLWSLQSGPSRLGLATGQERAEPAAQTGQ